MLGYFMESLMDFSVAIKLEKDRKAQTQIEIDKGGAVAMAAKEKKFQLEEYYRNAGQANYELAQYSEALQHFCLIIDELGAKAPINRFNRGLCYIKTGQHDLAEEDLKAALKGFEVKDETG